MKDLLMHGSTLLAILLLLFVLVSPARAQNGTQAPGLPNTVNDPPPPDEQTPTNTEGDNGAITAASQAPVINVWYNSNMRFGHLGTPQEQINILGNVYDPDGSVRSLSYRLNDRSSIGLEIGPDDYRLARNGDFNISIPITRLRDGSNTVWITAVDNSGDPMTTQVNFTYFPNTRWAFPYSTSWGSAGGNITNQAQIVDGLWQITNGGVRPVQVGYDRLINIGDMTWGDYEVTVPITVHGWAGTDADPGGVGVIVRWQGHTGTGEPPTGWSRLGAYGYYSNRAGALALRLNDTSPPTQSFNLVLGRTYIFKLRAETTSQGGKYSLKVWESGTNEPSWSDSRFSRITNLIDSNNDLLRGSVLLVAHRVDATFGDVTINRVGAQPVVQNYRNYLPSVIR